MYVDMVFICTSFNVFPVWIKPPRALQYVFQVGSNTIVYPLTTESGHNDDVILGLIHAMCCFDETHTEDKYAAEFRGRQRKLLSPPPLQAGNSRWVRKERIGARWKVTREKNAKSPYQRVLEKVDVDQGDKSNAQERT